MRRDPFAQKSSAPTGGALQHFTDREQYVAAFRRHLERFEDEELQTLVFYGVGGIGKTTLMQKLCLELQNLPETIPFARFNLENIADQTQAYREVLLRLRADLENGFKIEFPHFDLGLAVILAREGGEPPPMVTVSPNLKTAFDVALEFTPDFVRATTKLFGHGLHQAMEKSDKLKQWVRKVGGTQEVADLSERLAEDDQIAQEELVRRFAQDLAQHLPDRPGRACRGVLFLDTYESLWTGRESGASAQARLLDEWVRGLAEYCLAAGTLIVITGRDGLRWIETDPEWDDLLDQHLMGGLSASDAQLFLSRRDVGPPPPEPAAPLQEAMIRCANTTPAPDGPISCHLLTLALCADIVRNTRETSGHDPAPATFAGVPTAQTAGVLATRFLKSLHNRNMELWVEGLSLTPRFDEAAALALDTARQYHNGRAGWEGLIRYSFVLPQPDGFYRMHRVMREALRARLSPTVERVQQEWFAGWWDGRREDALAFYHRWRSDPAGTLAEWRAEHEAASAALQVPRARALLNHWAEIGLDGDDRAGIDDLLWATTHAALGQALWRTPLAPRKPLLRRAAEHFRAALDVFHEDGSPEAWAAARSDLALALVYSVGDDPAATLHEAMDCLNAALRVYTPATHPEPWANTQNHLGIVWAKLPFQDQAESAANQRHAIACFEATNQVWTEQSHPKIWARGQHNLGVSYILLPDGDRRENLGCAIEYFQAALRGRTRDGHPTGWALTQWNLGEAYRQLPGATTADLEQAIAYFEASLTVYTEDDFPEMWAEAQNGLGTAWRDLPGEPREDSLRRALSCYEAALRVWNDDDCPADWAMVQNNMGLAVRELAKVSEDPEMTARAARHFEAAVRGFETAGMAKEAAEAAGALLS